MIMNLFFENNKLLSNVPRSYFKLKFLD